MKNKKKKKQRTKELLEKERGAMNKFVSHNINTHEVRKDMPSDSHNDNAENENVNYTQNKESLFKIFLYSKY